jgi:hypothetical protein
MEEEMDFAVETKTCKTCGETKPVTEYHTRSGQAGYRTQCKKCWNTFQLAKYHNDPAVKQQHKRSVKARYDNFGRYARYGINAEQYDEILLRQGGKCALCSASQPGGKGVWHIDHQHGHDEPKVRKSWKAPDGCVVRGLLCHSCNVRVGAYQSLLKDVPEARLLAYLGLEHLKDDPPPLPR